MDAMVGAGTAHSTLAGRHIVIVEDEYLLMDDLCCELTLAGATIAGVAGSVADSLELIAGAARIDATVLDVNLMGEMAHVVADELAGRGVPFVLITGYDADLLGGQYPDVPCIQKPAGFSQIAAALASVLGR